MDRELMQSAQQFHIRRRQRSIWKKLVSVLGCIVVFCTTYALILPAITMERETICGIQEHQHSDSCYTKQVVKQLVCSAKDTGVHTHSAECGSDCGYADFVIHEHAAVCYDGSGALVCTLPQVKEHAHLSDCYRIPQIVIGQHNHTDACYSMQQAELLCALAESDGHTHTEGCMSQISKLVCEQEEGETHTHAETCYRTESALSCGKEEMQAHHHTDDCYRWERRLSCGKEEGPIYGSGEPELTCTQKEVKAHTHTAQCFNTDGNWICGQLQILRHVHNQSCFDTSQTKSVLTCDLEEHIHTQACFAEVTEATEETTEATEETTEATEEATEETEEEQTMPAQSFQGLTKSNVVILADADAGAFPAGTTMYASDVAVATARKLAEENADEDTEILDAVGVNIIFRNAEGTIIEPENGALVRVNIVLPEEKKLEGKEFTLVHRHNDGSLETVETAEVNSDGAGFTTESFSMYVITALGPQNINEIHAILTVGTNGLQYYPNSIDRPYILRVGDSVEVYCLVNSEDNGWYNICNISPKLNENNEEIYENGVLQYNYQWDWDKNNYEECLSHTNVVWTADMDENGQATGKKRGSVKLNAIKPLTGTEQSICIVRFGNDTFYNDYYFRVQNDVYVEAIPDAPSSSNPEYFTHVDLEIESDSAYTDVRTETQSDGTVITTTTLYDVSINELNFSQVLDTSGNPIPIELCTDFSTPNWDVCPYEHTTTVYNIPRSRYVLNTNGGSQNELTSQRGHLRFDADQADGALFDVIFTLKPISQSITTTSPDTQSVTVSGDISNMTPQNIHSVVTVGHHSMIDAYNTCPNHSGLDYHIGGDLNRFITLHPANATVRANKRLNGTALPGNMRFTFELCNLVDGAYVVKQTAVNDANGNVSFETLTFSNPGTYTYYLRERNDSQSFVSGYDSTVYTVVITVSQNADGTLSAAVTYNGSVQPPTFNNTVSATAVLGARKVLMIDGNDTPQSMTDGQFSFELRKVIDSNHSELIQTVTNKADGSIEFTQLTFDQSGTYQYIIQESRPNESLPGMTYDSKEVKVSINVPEDFQVNGWTTEITYDGVKYSSVNDLPVFTNKQYNSRGSLTITKTVVGTPVTEGDTYYIVLERADGAAVDWVGKVSSSRPNPNTPVTQYYGKSAYIDIHDGETITVQDIPSGVYTINEWSSKATKDPNNKSFDVSYSGNGVDSSQGWFASVSVPAPEGGTRQIDVTNTYAGSLSITKKVEGNTAPPDNTDYTVTLTRKDQKLVDWTDVEVVVSSRRSISLTGKSNSTSFTIRKDETVTLNNLPAGNYSVTESYPRATVTYNFDANNVNIVAKESTKGVITNTFPTGYELPATGGPGTGRYTLGGFAMAAGAVLWLCYRRKRRREGG